MNLLGVFIDFANRPISYRSVAKMAELSRNIQDEDRLAEMGYKQELQRDWSMLHNFGVSFSIIVGDPECCQPIQRRTQEGNMNSDVECYRVLLLVSRRRCRMLKVAGDLAECCLPYSLFEYGLTIGGPGVMSVGWIIVSFFSPSCPSVLMITSC